MVEQLSPVESSSLEESLKEGRKYFDEITEALKKACVLVAEDPLEKRLFFLCGNTLFDLMEEEIKEEPLLEKPPEGIRVTVRQIEGFEQEFYFTKEE